MCLKNPDRRIRPGQPNCPHRLSNIALSATSGRKKNGTGGAVGAGVRPVVDAGLGAGTVTAGDAGLGAGRGAGTLTCGIGAAGIGADGIGAGIARGAADGFATWGVGAGGASNFTA